MAKSRKRHQKLISELSMSLADCAIIALGTSFVSYDFASSLNHLYHLHLVRDEDIAFSVDPHLTPANCPLFIYYDESSRLFHILVDLSQSSKNDCFGIYDKFLILMGDQASRRIESLYNDFTEFAHRMVDPYDILAQQHDDLRMKLVRGILNVDFFDFRQSINSRLPNLSDGYQPVVTPSRPEQAPYSQLALLEDYQHQYDDTLSSPSSKTRKVFSLAAFEDELPLPSSSIFDDSIFEYPQTDKAVRIALKRQRDLKNFAEASEYLVQTIETYLSNEVNLPYNFS